MPRNSYCPRWALMLEADWRPWRVVLLDLYTRGGVGVFLQGYTPGGAGLASGLYPDALAGLCGRATSAVFRLIDSLGALGGLALGIDTNDRVYIESITAAWAVVSGGAALGFTGPVASVNVGGGVWRCTAQADWTRGPLDLGALALAFTAGGPFVTTDEACQVQDVPAALRLAGYTGDGVAWGTRSLISADTMLIGDGEHRHGWHIDQYGRVVESGADGISRAVWVDTSFRDWLGFTGSEALVWHPSCTRWTVTATRPCTGVLCPSRPAERVDHETKAFGDGARLVSGETVTVQTGHRRTLRLGPVHIDGPLDAAPSGVWVDLSDHFHRSVAPYLTPGARCELYQDHGDCRRVGRTALGQTYGLARTVEEEPYRGRVEAAVAIEAPGTLAVSWPQVLRRRGSAPDMVLDVVEDR